MNSDDQNEQSSNHNAFNSNIQIININQQRPQQENEELQPIPRALLQNIPWRGPEEEADQPV